MFNMTWKSYIFVLTIPVVFVIVTDTLQDLENERLFLEDESVEAGRVKLSNLRFLPNN